MVHVHFINYSILFCINNRYEKKNTPDTNRKILIVLIEKADFHNTVFRTVLISKLERGGARMRGDWIPNPPEF